MIFTSKNFFYELIVNPSKEVLQKDVKNLVSKQIFARWQAILSAFDFQIEFIKGVNNSLPDFLTREFLQGTSATQISLQEQSRTKQYKQRKPLSDKFIHHLLFNTNV